MGRRGTAWGRAVGAFSAALALGGCPDSGERIALSSLALVDYSRGALLASPEGPMEELRRTVLGLEGVSATSGTIQARGSVRVSVAEQPDGSGVVLLGLEIHPVSKDGARLAVNASAPLVDDHESAVRKAFQDLTRAVRERWELRRLSDDVVVRRLQGEVTSALLQEVADRRLRAAVPTINQMIGDERVQDIRVLDAVGALVAIGDPAGAPGLIAATRRKPIAFWPQILYALAQLGGEQAEGFLFTVSRGHEDARIRDIARQALDEMRAPASEGAR